MHWAVCVMPKDHRRRATPWPCWWTRCTMASPVRSHGRGRKVFAPALRPEFLGRWKLPANYCLHPGMADSLRHDRPCARSICAKKACSTRPCAGAGAAGGRPDADPGGTPAGRPAGQHRRITAVEHPGAAGHQPCCNSTARHWSWLGWQSACPGWRDSGPAGDNARSVGLAPACLGPLA